ncbi:MAG: PAS domain S-box protein [Pedobacter sp.]
MTLVLEGSGHDQEALQQLLQDHGYRVSLRCGDIPDAAALPETAEEDLPLAFMQHFIDGVLIVDVETVGVKYANNAFAEMLGYSLEEVHRQKVWDWDAVWSREEIERMYATRNWIGERFETRLRRKDGQLLDVDVSHKPISWRGMEVILCVIKDISERKKTERVLHLTQFTVEKADVQAHWMTPEGRFFYVNEAACTALGYSREELVGMPVWEIDPNITRENAIDYWWQLKEKGSMHFESLHRAKDGRIYPVEVRGNYINFDGKEYSCVFVTDLSACKQAEQQLRQASLVLENSPAVVFRWGGADDWPVEMVSRNVTQFGYTPEELLSGAVPFAQLVHPEDFGRITAEVTEHVSQGRDRFQLEYRVVTNRGDIRWVDDRTVVERDDQGRVTHYQGIILDITDRKRTELVMAARMRLLQFAISHTLAEQLEATLDEAEKLTDSQIGFFVFLDADQKTLSLQNWSTRTKREFCTAQGKGLHYPVSQAGVWADCLHQRRPVIHNDYASLPHRKGLPPGHSPLIRELVVPVFRGENIVAIVAVGNKPQDYTQQDVEAVSLLADLAWEIAERKHAEEALRKSECKYRSIVEHAPFGITRSTREGKLLSVNPALASILKFDSEQELMETVNLSSIQDEFFPKPDERASLVEKILAQDSWYVFNNRLRCKDGSTVTCRVHSRRIADENGQASEFESFQENITEQLAAEQALRESEEKFRVLAETSPVAICLYQEDRHIYANPAMERLFGFDTDEFCHMKIWDMVHGDYKDLVRERGLARLAGQSVPSQYEFKYLTKAGEERHVLISAGTMEYQGRSTGVASFLDITERKRTEELIRDSLAEKEVLLKEIHHRVKNNLQVVSSLLFLQSQKFNDPELQTCFLESQSRICSMALAHEQLYQSKNLAEISIKSYVENLVGQLQEIFPSPDQAIDCQLTVEDLELDIAKVVPCGLLITELLSNAYKHAFVDGRSGQVTISMKNSAGQIDLAVADNGVGCPAGFDYRRAKTLGLQLVTALTNQLNGTLELERDSGTRFRVCFAG